MRFSKKMIGLPCSVRRLFFPILFLAPVSFFLNFFWEMMQVPFFAGMSSSPHLTVVYGCTRAALGDVFIMVAAYGVTARLERNERWLINVRLRRARWLFIGLGELATILIEAWSIGTAHRWQYSDLMPVIPWVGIGVIPLFQWLLVPLVTLSASRWLCQGFIIDSRNSRYPP